MSDRRSAINFLDFEKLSLVESTVDTVFKERIKCTKEEHEILLLKAYSNILDGCVIKSIDTDVPESEIDTYKQYDKKCRVIFDTPDGIESCFYMSYQSSGREAVNYWKLKYKNLEQENQKLREALLKIAKAIDSLAMNNWICDDIEYRNKVTESLERITHEHKELIETLNKESKNE
jgi:hypothetical protein